MKKLILFLFFIFLINKSKSQVVFCPPGAEWHYSFYAMGLNQQINIVNESIKYIRDSVVNNESFKILYHKKFFIAHNRFNVLQSLIKQNGDTIFVKNNCTANKWQTLYNFAALPGQSWKIVVYPFLSSPTYSITYTVSVQSVSTININNFNLKRLHVTYTSYADSKEALITERLGCETFMFNYRNTFDSDGDYFAENLCYRDDAFGLKQYTEKPCDYTYNVGIRETHFQNANIQIYPNPTFDFFTLSSENDPSNEKINLVIKDIHGREIRQRNLHQLNSEPTKIDVSDLPEGLYLVSVYRHNEVIYTCKLIKRD